MSGPTSNPTPAAARERLFVQPADVFAGIELWPLTPASRSWYHMAASGDMSEMLAALIFLFIHRKRGAETFEHDAKAFVGLVTRDIDELHVQAMAQLNEISDEDKLKLVPLVKEIFGRDRATKAKAGPLPGSRPGSAKKKETTRRS